MAQPMLSNNMISRHTDIIVALGIISIVIMMIIPLPTALLDVLIVFNITCSLTILLVPCITRNRLICRFFLPCCW